MEELQLDPIRQVRVAKTWAIAGIVLAAMLLAGLSAISPGLSDLELAFVLAPAAGVAVAAIELAARWEARMHRRYAYPHRLGYVLAGIHSFDQACARSVDLLGEWLHLEAVVVGWLTEDGQTVRPVAAYGLPDGWREHTPDVSAAECGLTAYRTPPSRPATRSTSEDPWFKGRSPAERCVWVPLVSRDVPHGVLAISARRRNPQLGDSRLLAALGMVLGMSLDNCRLYDGQRAHAQHFQELHRMKTDFLMTVSHELRTPLTSIMMAAEMLLEEEETRNPDSTRGRLVRNIVKGAARLRCLVDDLVAVSRQDDFQPRLEVEAAPLRDAITNAVSIVQPLVAAKSQTIDVEMADPEAVVRVDRLRFEQVLINLLSNAQRYSPPGGHIRVSSEELANGETLIVVTDCGPGVPADEAGMIFEPFYRGDRSGLGLGLAIAKSIVDLHSGRIWVEPAPGQGSRFCVAIAGANRVHSVAAQEGGTAEDCTLVTRHRRSAKARN